MAVGRLSFGSCSELLTTGSTRLLESATSVTVPSNVSFTLNKFMVGITLQNHYRSPRSRTQTIFMALHFFPMFTFNK
jgi:hypothetical protein